MARSNPSTQSSADTVPALSRPPGAPVRLDARYALGELAEELISFDRGFLHTLLGLLRDPGATLRRWVVARDARLCRPFRFLLIALTLAFAVNWLSYTLQGADADTRGAFGEFTAGLIHGLQEGGNEELPSGPEATGPKFPEVIAWINQRAMWWVLLLVPMLAASMRFAFRRYDINFAEHWVVSCYAFASASLWAAISAVPLLLLPRWAWIEAIVFGVVLLRTLAALPELPRSQVLWRALGGTLMACFVLLCFAICFSFAFLAWKGS